MPKISSLCQVCSCSRCVCVRVYVCVCVCVRVCLRVCVTHSHLVAARRLVSTYHSSAYRFLCGLETNSVKSSSSYSTLPVFYDRSFELYCTKYYVLFYWEDNVFQFKLFTSRGQTWTVAVWSTRLPTVSGRDSDRLEHLGNVLEVGNSITSLHKP